MMGKSDCRPAEFPRLEHYEPSGFMLPTSHYDAKKADRAVTFIENLRHTKGKWAGKRFWLLPWQEQIDRLTDEEAAQIAAGEPADWVKETHEICKEIYGFTPEGTDISYDYLFKYTPVVERQFLRGGHRLARLLNEIYR